MSQASSVRDYLWQFTSEVRNQRWSGIASRLLWAFDATLTVAILFNVRYTEIDWKAYMEQVAQVLQGERDYALIKGGTGPLCYPAGHVWIYSGLYKFTGEGKDIFSAQIIFVALYLVTLAITFSLYLETKVPPYILPLLCLSKRLHSLYVLRLFNDCWTQLFVLAACSLYIKRQWTAGSLFYALALSVKMNALLYLPGILCIITIAASLERAASSISRILEIQVLLALPFARFPKSYLSKAFDFGRAFLWEWTVNWRFVGENIFLSKWFAWTLLLGHFFTLFFFAVTRWLTPTNLSPIEFLKTCLMRPTQPLRRDLSKVEMLTILFTSNMIGSLFARSLHYQFYSWTAWTLPFLVWRTNWHPLAQIGIWLLEEWAWNVYPSTEASSFSVVAVYALVLFGVWWNWGKELAQSMKQEAEKRQQKELMGKFA